MIKGVRKRAWVPRRVGPRLKNADFHYHFHLRGARNGYVNDHDQSETSALFITI